MHKSLPNQWKEGRSKNGSVLFSEEGWWILGRDRVNGEGEGFGGGGGCGKEWYHRRKGKNGNVVRLLY